VSPRNNFFILNFRIKIPAWEHAGKDDAGRDDASKEN
jgi:hypothetical protein